MQAWIPQMPQNVIVPTLYYCKKTVDTNRFFIEIKSCESFTQARAGEHPPPRVSRTTSSEVR